MRKNEKYRLRFISDADLYDHTKETVKRFRTGMTLEQFKSNIVDPIKMTFDTHVYGKSVEDVIDSEVMRQLNKSNENLIGNFHQNMFKFVGGGWEVPQTGADGFDVENHERHIFAEIKNKHNTMNSSSAKSVHSHMRGLIQGDTRACCYLVEIVAKTSQDIPWKLASSPLREDRQERLRRISIDRFYEIVTGDPTAFRDLCSVLGRVIDDILEEDPNVVGENSVLKELKLEDGDVLRTIFKMSFGSYRGFDDFSFSR